MNWMQVLVNLLLTGVLLYVFQKIIDERSNKRMEKFKTELKLTAFEEETKFSKLHEERMQILLGIHKRILLVKRNLYAMQLELEGDRFDEKIKKIISDFDESLADFRLYYEENQLYLPIRLYHKLFYYYITLSIVWSDFSASYLNYDYSKRTDENPDDYVVDSNRRLLFAVKKKNEKLEPLTTELEKEIRLLIGSA